MLSARLPNKINQQIITIFDILTLIEKSPERGTFFFINIHLISFFYIKCFIPFIKVSRWYISS